MSSLYDYLDSPNKTKSSSGTTSLYNYLPTEPSQEPLATYETHKAPTFDVLESIQPKTATERKMSGELRAEQNHREVKSMPAKETGKKAETKSGAEAETANIWDVRRARQAYYDALDNGKDATAEKARLDELTAKTGIDPSSNFIGVAAKEYGSNVLETAGTLLEAANQGMAHQVDTPLFVSDVIRGKVKDEGYTAPTKATYNEDTAQFYKENFYDNADTLAEKAKAEREDITTNRSKLGKLSVDVGVEGAKLLSDIAVNSLVAGAGAAAMYTRAFGSAAQEAREAGADMGQRLAYGAANAAIEALTEKLGGAFTKVYGGKAGAELTDYVVGKIAKTEAGQKAWSLLFKTLGEGAEEGIADIINPITKSIYNGKTIGENYSELEAGDVAYDMLIGAILGFAGAATNVGGGDAETEQFFRDASKNGLTFKEACEAWAGYQENVLPNLEKSTAEAQEVVDKGNAKKATTEAQPEIKTILESGRVNATTAKEIVNDPIKSLSFEQITGINLAEEADPVKAVQRGARNYAYEQILAQQEAQKAASEAEAKAQTEAENNAVRNSGYESYVRGMYNGGNITYADASEIANSESLRSVWENMTGKTLPANGKSAVKMIMQTDVNTAKVTLNDPLAFLFPNEQTPQTAQNAPQTAATETQQTTPEVAPIAQQTANTELNSQPTAKAQTETQNAPIEKAQTADMRVDDTTPTLTGELKRGQSNVVDTAQTVAEPSQQTAKEQTTLGIKESGYSENIKSDTNREEAVRRAIESDPFFYEIKSNAETLEKATAIYAKGFENAKQELVEKISAAKNGMKLSPEYVPLSKLIADEMTRNGDIEGARQILADVSVELTTAGQLGQAAIILRNLDPTAKATAIEKFVSKINEQLTKGQKNKNIKRGVGTAEGEVEVSQELLDKFSSAQTDAERDAALDNIMDNIAGQIPSTFIEKVTAMRYLNMLGNLKTQGRNIVGNLFMKGATVLKNTLATSIEQLANVVSGGKVERTKSLFTSKELKAQARADFENVKSEAMGENKHTAASRFSNDIQERRVMFDNKALEGYIKATSWAMEQGDNIFVKWEYTQALAGWMKAHGITDMSKATAKQLNSGRKYAIKQAQETTSRDSNAVSDWVSSIGRSKNTPTAIKVVAEGVIPFRKTPANVAVRAFEYSPLGIAETIAKAKNGAQAAEIIDSASKNITGSALALVGYLLAAAGKARTENEDDELEYYEQQQGKQAYSIKVGDSWISLSQFAPMSIPFFMGTGLYEATQDSISPKDFTKVANILTTPMVEMSMLSGINDVLDNISSFSGDDFALWTFAKNSAISYLTQVLTNTLAGQFEQASEKVRMTSYTEGDSLLSRDTQKAISKASAKIPGVDYQQEEYVDAWGRTESNGGIGERIFNAFINPTYTSKGRSESVDAEIQRLYEDNKDVADFPNVLPEKISRTKKLSDGGTMTSEEYVAFAKDSGQQKLELVTDLLDSEEYKDMTDKQRAEVIQSLYQYANDRALMKVEEARGNEKASNWDKVDEALETDEVAEYLAVKRIASDAYNGKSFDVLDGILDSYGALSDSAKALLDSGDTSQLDNIYAAMKVGISSEEWSDAYEKKKAISEESKSANQKTTEFSNYLDNEGYTTKQKETLLDQMGFYSQIKGNDEKYDALKSTFSDNKAYAITEAMQGKSTNMEKASAIGGISVLTTDKERLEALHAYFPIGSDGKEQAIYRRYSAAINSGYSFADWTKVENAKSGKNKKEAISAFEKLGYSGSEAKALYRLGWG